MNKQDFLTQLREALSGLPEDDVVERLTFYNEMIDDRVEDGLSEEAAVAELGSVDTIVSQSVADIPLPKLVKERMKPKRRLHAWEIVLLFLSFPVWFPLLIAAFVVLLSVYVVIWAVIISLWAAEVSLIAGCFGSAGSGFLFFCQGNWMQGLVMISAGMALAGLSIILFFGCKAMTGGALLLTKKIALGVKSLFLRKENAE